MGRIFYDQHKLHLHKKIFINTKFSLNFIFYNIFYSKNILLNKRYKYKFIK